MWEEKKVVANRKLTGKNTKENKSNPVCQVYSKWLTVRCRKEQRRERNVIRILLFNLQSEKWNTIIVFLMFSHFTQNGWKTPHT